MMKREPKVYVVEFTLVDLPDEGESYFTKAELRRHVQESLDYVVGLEMRSVRIVKL